MPWEGYNFEDAILINERLVYNDIFTSVHIERYKIEIELKYEGNHRNFNNSNYNPLPVFVHFDKYKV